MQDPNIVLSSLVNSESKILFDREPLTRVAKVAPWLTTDGDPYPVVVGGRVKWIIDGYTTTNAYPYSSRTTLKDATADAITATSSSVATLPSERINYLRNSVKAVVDAYDGTVTLYAWDPTDPLLQTWTKAFGGTVTPIAEAAPELVRHFRYPEDMFKVQRTILSRYHVEDPASFYNGQDFWTIPNDPTNRAVNALQPPYYLTLRMPGTTEPKFSLTTTFAPLKRQTLAAFMAVDSAPGPTYGTIRVLQLPRNTTVPGPTQVQNNFESEPAIAEQLTLLRRGGADVEYGNLLSLPVSGGLLYVEPVYVRASQGQGYPLLRKVLVNFGDTTVLRNSLGEALAAVFSGTGSGTATGPTRAAATPEAATRGSRPTMPRPTWSRRSPTPRLPTRRARTPWPAATSRRTARRRTSSRPPWTGLRRRSAGSPGTPSRSPRLTVGRPGNLPPPTHPAPRPRTPPPPHRPAPDPARTVGRPARSA